MSLERENVEVLGEWLVDGGAAHSGCPGAGR